MKNLFIKLLLLTLVCLAVFSVPVSVFAKEAVPFTINTSKTDDFQPSNDYSITFSPELTVNATSVKGARVVITVSYDEASGLAPVVYGPTTIGASCKLIQPVGLNVGDNNLEITVSKDGYETQIITHNIKRKAGTIKESLKNLIVIPGSK